MQNAIFTISHFQVSGSLDTKKQKKNICVLTVCLLSFSTHSPTSLKTTSSPSSHLPGSSFHTCSRTHTDTSRRAVCEARRAVSWAADWHHAHAQAFLQSPVTCMLRHTPRLQAEAHVRHPIANCLLPALSYSLSTLLQASSPRRLWNRPRDQMRYITFCTDLSSRIFAAEWESGRVLQRRLLPFISRNLKIYSYFAQECNNTTIFNTNIQFWS